MLYKWSLVQIFKDHKKILQKIFIKTCDISHYQFINLSCFSFLLLKMEIKFPKFFSQKLQITNMGPENFIQQKLHKTGPSGVILYNFNKFHLFFALIRINPPGVFFSIEYRMIHHTHIFMTKQFSIHNGDFFYM